MAEIITDVGLNKTATMVHSVSSVAPFNYIAIGSGTTAPTSSDTALETEVERAQADVSVAGGKATLSHTFSFTSNVAISEVGILNASSGGDLLGRSVFGTMNFENGESLQVIVNVEYSR